MKAIPGRPSRTRHCFGELGHVLGVDFAELAVAYAVEARLKDSQSVSPGPGVLNWDRASKAGLDSGLDASTARTRCAVEAARIASATATATLAAVRHVRVSISIVTPADRPIRAPLL